MDKRHLSIVPPIQDGPTTPELTPFPVITVGEDGAFSLDMDIAGQFLRAIREHRENGLDSEVIEQLEHFPDVEFAARIALDAAQKSGSIEYAELAKSLAVDNEEIQQAAGAIVIQKMMNPKAVPLVPEQPPIKAPETPAKPSVQPPEILSDADLNNDLLHQIHESVLQGSVRSASQLISQTAPLIGIESRAKEEFDSALVSLVAQTANSGQISHANTYLKHFFSTEARQKGEAVFDQGVLIQVQDLTTMGRLSDADNYIKKLYTDDATKQAEIIFDQGVLAQVQSCLEAAQLSDAQALIKRAKLTKDAEVMKLMFNNRVKQLATESLQAGRPSDAKNYLQRLYSVE